MKKPYMTIPSAINKLRCEQRRNNTPSVDIAYCMAIEALQKQDEINHMSLIEGHRKCVLGKDKMYSDSTLQSMTKEELIHLLHIAQHNYEVVLETLNNRVKYYESELAKFSDEATCESNLLRR